MEQSDKVRDLLEKYRSLKGQQEPVRREYNPNELVKSLANVSRSFGTVAGKPISDQGLNASLDRDTARFDQDENVRLQEDKQNRMLQSKNLQDDIGQLRRSEEDEKKHVRDLEKASHKFENAKRLLEHSSRLKGQKEPKEVKPYKLPQTTVEKLENLDTVARSATSELGDLKNIYNERGILGRLKDKVLGSNEKEQILNDVSKLYNKVFDPTTGVTDAEAKLALKAVEQGLLDSDATRVAGGIDRMVKSIDNFRKNRYKSFYRSQAAQGGEDAARKYIEHLTGDESSDIFLKPGEENVKAPLPKDVQQQSVQKEEENKEVHPGTDGMQDDFVIVTFKKPDGEVVKVRKSKSTGEYYPLG